MCSEDTLNRSHDNVSHARKRDKGSEQAALQPQKKGMHSEFLFHGTYSIS
jgi:hypothetical protein